MIRSNRKAEVRRDKDSQSTQARAYGKQRAEEEQCTIYFLWVNWDLEPPIEKVRVFSERRAIQVESVVPS